MSNRPSSQETPRLRARGKGLTGSCVSFPWGGPYRGDRGMTPSVPTSVQLALGLQLLLQRRSMHGRGRALAAGPPVASPCGRLRQARGSPGGGVRPGHAGPALRGPLCSAGTAPMTRWCPCSRAAAPCPLWWWRRGSSRSPAVRRPWPWAALAAGAPAWVARGGIPESTGASALPADLQLPSPGWAASGLPLQPHPHLSPQLGRSPGPSSWANLA